MNGKKECIMKVELISYSQPSKEMINEGIGDCQDLISFCARVSNPTNQLNTDTSEKLIKYLIKNRTNGNIFETPQFAYILIAAYAFINYPTETRLSYVRKFYDAISKHKINLPTPVMARVRTPSKNYASCCLIGIDDTKESITASGTAISLATASRCGIGIDVSRIRAMGSPVNGGSIVHTGVIPFLKVYEACVKAWCQNSTRGGCFEQGAELPVLDNDLDGTPIIITKTVDQISIGDLVLCWDFENNILTYKPIVDKFQPVIEKDKQITINLKNNLSLTTSTEHRLWCKNGIGTEEWVIAGNILPGDMLLDDSGNYIEVLELIQSGTVDETFYDFTVEDNHNYFAGKNGKFILSHNSATSNIQWWHYEIEDVVVLKNNSGTDDNRVRKLDYTVGMSKLFYDRVIKNESITLFSPHEVPHLYQAWGSPKFDKVYEECENDRKIKMKKKISARKLMSLIVKERVETGRIYILNVDTANEHSAWSDQITMSNLCTEVIQPFLPINDFNDPNGEIGMCILSAINMLEIKNWGDLEKTCELIVRFLDEIIDVQDYFNKAAENFAKKRRSLGVGITNLAAFLAKNELKYTSSKTLPVLDEWMEHFQYYLLKASVQMAKEKGKCEKFDHTKYSKGILPIDTYKKKVNELVRRKYELDWDQLRKEIKEHGLRHSTLSAIMPCESSSVIQNSTNGVEPVRSLITYKISKMGKLPVLAPGIGKYEQNYELAFDLPDNTGIININAVLQKYIDMAISTNLYYNYSHYPNHVLPDSKVMKEIMYAYSTGLISLYYNNTDDGDKEQSLKEENSDCASGACKL